MVKNTLQIDCNFKSFNLSLCQQNEILNSKTTNTMKNTAKQIEDAKALLRTNGYFTQNLWTSTDVNEVLSQKELPEFTTEEVVHFFDYCGENYNAEQGMNWDSLSGFLDEYMELKEA